MTTIPETSTQEKNNKVMLALLSLLFVFPLFNDCVILLCRDGGLHSSYYFVGYETGFGARKLLGTLFSLMLPDYTTRKDLIPYVFAVLLFICILFIAYVYRSFKNTDFRRSNNSLPFFLVTAIYMASSYGIQRALSLVWYADIWLYLSALIFVIVFVKHRKRHWFPVFALLMVVLSCLIHHIFCCLFFPLFAALFIYEVLPDRQVDKRKAVIYGGICLALGILFVCLWRFSTMNISVDELRQRLMEHTDNVCDKDPFVLNLLYGSSASNYQGMWDVGQFPTRYIQLPFLFLFLSPLIMLFVMPWILSIRHSHHGAERAKYTLMLLASTLLFLPIFAVATDYGRWWMAWFFCQTLLLLTMYRLGDRHIISAMRYMFGWCRKHPIVSILLVVYILLLRISPTDNAGIDVLSYAREFFA